MPSSPAPASGDSAAPPPSERAPLPAGHVPVAPSTTLTCWDCDAPNPPSRMFCVECGTFIAVGSKAFSRDTAGVPAASTALSAPQLGATGVDAGGMMSLGSYSAVMRRQEQSGRRRLRLTLVSVALAAVVGLAAVYTALTPSDRGQGPQSAAALLTPTPTPTAPLTPTPAPTAPSSAEAEPSEAGTRDADRRTSADLQALADIRPVDGFKATAPPVEVDRLTAPPPAATAVAELATEPLRPAAEQALADKPDEDPAETGRADRTGEGDAVVRRNGWVCAGEVRLDDPRDRSWSVGRVSFLEGQGYERVILHLDRIGSSGGSASVSAEAFPSSRVPRFVPGVRQPTAGRTTVAVSLDGSIRNNLGLKGYRPSGLKGLREFSVFSSARGSSRTLVSSAVADACFRLRVPAWNSSANARKAQVIVDIKSS